MKPRLVLLAAVAILVVAFSGSSRLLAAPVSSSADREAGLLRLPGFRSPSGNIRCLLVPGSPSMMLCSIARADYAAKLQARCMGPTEAGVDWHGFTLSAGKRGMISCSGGILYNPDTQRPSYVALPYGKSWQHGAFTCSSRLSGVTCRNRKSHGLFLSRQTWRAW